MSLEEKIQISRVFDELGVDIIEAGFPIASPGDFEAVTAISKILKNSIPCGLSQKTRFQCVVQSGWCITYWCYAWRCIELLSTVFFFGVFKKDYARG